MNYLFVLIAGLLLLSCTSQSVKETKLQDLDSDASWIFTDDQFSYLVAYDTIAYPGDPTRFARVIKKINIYNNDSSDLIQAVIPEKFMCERSVDSSYAFVVEDMNFDGENDFRVISWTSTYADREYGYWFFNSQTGQFEKDSTMNHFMNPEFDPELKAVYTRWRSGVNENGHAIYIWYDENCELVIEQVQSVGIDPSIPPYLETFKLVDGEKKCSGKEIPTFISLRKTALFNLLKDDTDDSTYTACDAYATQQ